MKAKATMTRKQVTCLKCTAVHDDRGSDMCVDCRLAEALAELAELKAAVEFDRGWDCASDLVGAYKSKRRMEV